MKIKKKAYNNGTKVIYLTENDLIPDGFVKGGLCFKTPKQIRLDAEKSRLTQKKTWENKTEEERLLFSKKCSESHLNMSDEAKKQKVDKCRNTMSLKSQEELDDIRHKIGLGCKKVWNSFTKEERQSIAKKSLDNGGGWNHTTINKTIKDRYNVDNISQLSEVKAKVKKSLQQTSQSIWGCDNPLQAEENISKAKQAILEKYGVEYIGSSPEIQSKIKSTNMKRRGVPYGFNFDKCKLTSLSKYNVEYNCMTPQCINSIGAKCSNTLPNSVFSNLLDSLNINYSREFPIKRKLYDFKIGNVLIEVNPFATHNSTWGLYDKGGLYKDYHYNKTQIAIDNNYRCIHIWDWDDKDKIVKSLAEKIKIYARKCQIKLISEKYIVDEFLNKYHFQNTCKNQKICLGLYCNDELIQLMTFGEPRYNKKYEYELLRLCTKFGYKVVGGSEKLFKYFINNYKPKSIISYCDRSKFNGDVYERLHMKLKNISISKHWYNNKLNIHITDNFLRQRGFDQLFGSLFGNYGKGTSNNQLMLDNGFVEIYDAGQATYIWGKL